MLSNSAHLGRIAVAIALLGACLMAPSQALATPPLSDRSPVEATFPDPGLSAACGFPVTVTFTGSFAVRVFQDANGTVTREVDTQPATKLTYRGGGGEYTVPFSAVLHTDYPEGAFVGAPATMTLTGSGAPYLPGPRGSGRAVLDGIVVEVEDGFPFTIFTTLRSLSGNFTDQPERICAALSASR